MLRAGHPDLSFLADYAPAPGVAAEEPVTRLPPGPEETLALLGAETGGALAAPGAPPKPLEASLAPSLPAGPSEDAQGLQQAQEQAGLGMLLANLGRAAGTFGKAAFGIAPDEALYAGQRQQAMAPLEEFKQRLALRRAERQQAQQQAGRGALRQVLEQRGLGAPEGLSAEAMRQMLQESGVERRAKAQREAQLEMQRIGREPTDLERRKTEAEIDYLEARAAKARRRGGGKGGSRSTSGQPRVETSRDAELWRASGYDPATFELYKRDPIRAEQARRTLAGNVEQLADKLQPGQDAIVAIDRVIGEFEEQLKENESIPGFERGMPKIGESAETASFIRSALGAVGAPVDAEEARRNRSRFQEFVIGKITAAGGKTITEGEMRMLLSSLNASPFSSPRELIDSLRSAREYIQRQAEGVASRASPQVLEQYQANRQRNRATLQEAEQDTAESTEKRVVSRGVSPDGSQQVLVYSDGTYEFKPLGQ